MSLRIWSACHLSSAASAAASVTYIALATASVAALIALTATDKSLWLTARGFVSHFFTSSIALRGFLSVGFHFSKWGNARSANRRAKTTKTLLPMRFWTAG